MLDNLEWEHGIQMQISEFVYALHKKWYIYVTIGMG